MSKEMIVSLNGREKKIAIIENGQVTEFYIERGEEEQGIVGNIYKGRVMRVLPGMQSAFVNIGLERDAFLYVSDFFDEEEEFERIVIDKTKSSAPAEQIRSERPQATEIRTQPQRATTARRRSEVEEDEPALTEAALAQAFSEPAAVASELVSSSEDANLSTATGDRTLEAEGEQRGRGRERGGRRRRRDGGRGAEDETRQGSETLPEAARPSAQQPHATTLFTEDIATPFVGNGNSFQRVVDEELAAEEGGMFKDARLQERLSDQIHAIEFDIEAVDRLPVGALLSSAGEGNDSRFERIADDDAGEETRQRTLPATPVQTSLGAQAADAFAFEDRSVTSPTQGQYTFERVSDDAALESQAPAGQAAASTAGEEKRGGGRRQSTKKAKDTATEVEATPNANTKVRGKVVANEIFDTQASGKRRPARSSTSKSATKKASEAGRKTGTATRTRRGAAQASTNSIDEASSNASNKGELLADADAKVSKRSSRGEFAQRRRRRRRPAGGHTIQNENGAAEENGAATDGATVALDSETDEIAIASVSIAAEPEREVEAEQTPPLPAPVEVAGNGRPARGGNGHNRSSGGGGGRGGRERTPPPMITDLLREGQEILVQIAKEPIAAKGARITSHIALPGRFLVYMPTIEHVGVSRKIESESERVRLRRLIKAIREEEDVPSGGFIVRTAGTGITDEDLREDARYLVRTWRDIRREAERTKPATLVHRDLDLVQRILRDQLSDDFTAIRVDSETEYLQVVEFINRIQPRLVSRVKLYTRDEPILEAYGVQAEIDKAIKPRVWLRSGGYLVINQTEALVSVDVNTGKFVGRGGSRLEDTITKTNMEAVEEIARQIRLRDLGGIIVLDLIDMEERRNRHRVMQALQEALEQDKSPTKVLSFNDFGLVIMTRKRVKQSLERTLCAPCPYCQGAGLVKSAQTVCYEILEEARRLARGMDGEHPQQATLRAHAEIARALRSTERDVLNEIEAYLGAVDVTSEGHLHQEQFDFAFV
ncbi:MAG: Rne/Rng family ribonuclease [Pyrinomonadaceae bacterium]